MTRVGLCSYFHYYYNYYNYYYSTLLAPKNILWTSLAMHLNYYQIAVFSIRLFGFVPIYEAPQNKHFSVNMGRTVWVSMLALLAACCINVISKFKSNQFCCPLPPGTQLCKPQ